MDLQLLHAFRIARYSFAGPSGRLVLRVDEANPALGAWLVANHADCAAVLTAFNPQGRQRSMALNLAAQSTLRKQLRGSGLPFLAGTNEDPAGHWPVEESFLIAGLSKSEAHDLARHHGQLAFLWSDGRAIPEIVETSPES